MQGLLKECTAPVSSGPKSRDLVGKVSIGKVHKVGPKQLVGTHLLVKAIEKMKPKKDYFTSPSSKSVTAEK